MKRQIRSWRAYLFSAAIGTVALCSCSVGGADAPSETAARAMYEKTFQKLIDGGVLKIEGFKKTDAVKSQVNGVAIYAFEYEGNLFFPKGLMPECAVDHPQGMCALAMGMGSVIPQKVGAKVLDTGTIEFEKTENGWRARGVTKSSLRR
jgi:hypothetical protein